MSTAWFGKKYVDDAECPQFEQDYNGAVHISTQRVHPVRGRDSVPCVTVGAGPWREKLYHFHPD